MTRLPRHLLATGAVSLIAVTATGWEGSSASHVGEAAAASAPRVAAKPVTGAGPTHASPLSGQGRVPRRRRRWSVLG